MEVKQGFGDERRGWKESERERVGEREGIMGRDVVQERRKVGEWERKRER